MILNPPQKDATSGTAKAIFAAIQGALGPPPSNMPAADAAQLNDARAKLCYAIAAGIIAGLTGDSSASPDAAETYSSATEDTTFWNWLTGFVGVFHDWAPTTPDGLSLQALLNAYLSNHAVPQQLIGVVK
jgi:hypothetical protein